MDDKLKNMKYVTDDETGEQWVSLPLDDFEELFQQMGEMAEIEKGLKELAEGKVRPLEEVIAEMDANDAPQG